ncbi:TraB/GumN family protein [Saprospiraceae bacterium]|jgi:uncharacterized protein YbaP (TraB family)|nr:TraB/GumN family protein [Bacteroidota bacterium]MDB4728525.1 TraB/GumN family protein [Saprospiraceae bacterium]MDF1863849.1 TraB/GumN family protein [Saprospiraceae bacterium]
MKKLFAFYLLIFGFAFTSFSQVDVVEIAKTTAPTAEENSLLWQITGNDLTDTSFLYGTIHMIGKDDFFMTDEMKTAMKKSDMVTFEINMEEMTGLTSQLALLSKAYMNDNLTLKDLLSEEEYVLVQKHFQEIGMPLFFFERMKPMFLTVLADMDMSPAAMSSGEIVSYEMEIMQIAKSRDLKMGGLETAEYQMSMFDSIPYKAQAQMLIESIKSEDNGDEQFAEMVKLYKDQDILGMSSMISADEEGIGNYEDVLLFQRNRNWIPIMGKMMKEQPTFFAVGAGHLGGEYGVVSLLRQEGYDLVPLRRDLMEKQNNEQN